MGLRMKNFNILGVHWKIQFLGGRGYEKPIQMGGLPERVVWTVCRFKCMGAWQETEWFFWGRGSDTPMHIMEIPIPLKVAVGAHFEIHSP